jgi:hypothetical protein
MESGQNSLTLEGFSRKGERPGYGKRANTDLEPVAWHAIPATDAAGGPRTDPVRGLNSDAKAHILDIHHARMFTSAQFREVEVELTIETRGPGTDGRP